jgi:hypothetical protein
MPLAKRQERHHQDTLTGEYVEKLKRLMNEYGIKESALQLAIARVPGFLPTLGRLENGYYGAVIPGDKKGRPSKWSVELLDDLVVAVDNAKKEHGLTRDHEAISHLAQHGQWAGPTNRELNKRIKTLKNALAFARRIQRDADRLFELIETIKRDNPEKSPISLRD